MTLSSHHVRKTKKRKTARHDDIRQWCRRDMEKLMRHYFTTFDMEEQEFFNLMSDVTYSLSKLGRDKVNTWNFFLSEKKQGGE